MKIAVSLMSGMVLLAAAGTSQAAFDGAEAHMVSSKGASVGTVLLTQTVHGVLIKGDLHDLPPGVHGFHIHDTGKCDPPGFESAGGHFNPLNKEHGFMAVAGMHAGDLPNIHVGADGKAQFEMLTSDVTLGEGKGKNSVFGAAGSALVIHEKPDDYQTKPAGGAGARIACGIIKKTATADTQERR